MTHWSSMTQWKNQPLSNENKRPFEIHVGSSFLRQQMKDEDFIGPLFTGVKRPFQTGIPCH